MMMSFSPDAECNSFRILSPIAVERPVFYHLRLGAGAGGPVKRVAGQHYPQNPKKIKLDKLALAICR
jgi:hypothetical protein